MPKKNYEGRGSTGQPNFKMSEKTGAGHSYKATLEKLYPLSSSGANKYQTDESNEIKILRSLSIMETILENNEAAEQQRVAKKLQTLFSDPERFKSVVAQADQSGVDFFLVPCYH